MKDGKLPPAGAGFLTCASHWDLKLRGFGSGTGRRNCIIQSSVVELIQMPGAEITIASTEEEEDPSSENRVKVRFYYDVENWGNKVKKIYSPLMTGRHTNRPDF